MQGSGSTEAFDNPLLRDGVLRSTMTAMVTVIMGRNEATRADVEHYEMTWDGQTVTGIENAKKVLIDSLTRYSNDWISFLAESGNRKVATSLDVAVNDDVAADLVRTEQGERVLHTLRRVADVAPVVDLPGDLVDIRNNSEVVTS